MGKHIHKCEMCGKEFEDYFELTKFCSRDCYYKYRRKNSKLKELVCPVCNTLFKQSHSNQIFCSVECRIKSTENKVECTCEYCGKVFSRKKSEVDNNKHHYCSKECMNLSKYWSEEDTAILKNNFGKLSYKEMANMFFTVKTIDEIRRRAIYIGLTSSREWTEAEIDILINNYSKKPMNEVARLLPNRTVPSILGQARRKDLKSFFYINNIYTEDENDYLRNNYLTKNNDELGIILNRSPLGIAQHLWSLDLYRPTEKAKYQNLSEYIRKRILPWTHKIKRENNYTCALSGARSNIVIHHIRGFNLLLNEAIVDLNFPIYDDLSLYTEEQLDSLLDSFLLIQDTYNSYICINEKIHKKFHGIYGYGNNTEEQWIEFVNTYYK